MWFLAYFSILLEFELQYNLHFVPCYQVWDLGGQDRLRTSWATYYRGTHAVIDLKDAMTPAEITDALSLHSIKNHDWHIQACCALTGEGLYDGLGWIAQRVAGKATS
ncbi:UNVERIFIED_CONTAM: ADP-ribosylation factor-like protein 5 [Sesamum latifolium]|uniref:ADP-ribosylation factor-like protein 5 n=1 Tax=Sesamum latifolium TaxID=2727402 RepID=A0AAW2W112_9LAMI